MKELPTTNAGWTALAAQYDLRQSGQRRAYLVPERGEGIYMWDVEGNRYIDFQSGQLCLTLGHSHPEYVEAVCEQARKIIQTGSSFSAPSEVMLAMKIAELTPEPLKRTFFACSGSESVEAALRLAKKYTGRHEIVALVNGYHGQTAGSASITGRGAVLRDGYGQSVSDVSFIPTPYPYRCHFCMDKGGCTKTCAEYAEEIIDFTTSGEPAALFYEPMLSTAGQVVPTVEWTQEMRRICDERGMLMVADEALTGFGRTGKWFGFEHFGVVPDILACSKGLGGGVPLCSVTTSDEIADAALDKGYLQSSSHSGDPLLCAVGLKNLEIVERENLVENARVVGAYMEAKLKRMEEQYEIVGEARGLGLCLGLEMVTDKESRTPNVDAAVEVTRYCFDRKLWIAAGKPPENDEERKMGGRFGSHIIRFMPPISITEEQVDEALEIIEAGIVAAQQSLPARTG